MQPNPFWLYKSLVRPTNAAGELIPELVMPSGDAVWTTEVGKKMTWRDGWRSCWQKMLDQFGPHSEARTVVRYSRKYRDELMSAAELIAYQPKSATEWLRCIDDNRLANGRYHVRYRRLLDDIFGWAVECTLNYCRCRMGWGEWSIQMRGKYDDVSDMFFSSRPASQRGCKFLVGWFTRFANARRKFHLRIAERIQRPWHSQTRSRKSIKEIVAHHKGRPPNLKMGKAGNEDLWLILIWPIAVRHGWNYKDVVRALRLHFGHDTLGRAAPKMTPQQAARALEDFPERQLAKRPVNEWMPKAAVEWRSEALRVSAGDAEKMRLRCKRLGLEKLNPRRRDINAEPPLLSLVNGFASTV